MPPPCLKPALQDLHRSGLINHRPLLAAANAPLSEHTSGRDGGETLVDQPDWNTITEPAGQATSVVRCRLRRWAVPTGQRARESDHHLDHLMLDH